MYFIKNCWVWFLIFFLFSIISFCSGLYMLMISKVILVEYQLITINSMNVCFIMLLDYYSLIFMSFVLMISSMVIYYCQSYMDGDINLNRFLNLILLFVLSMMLLIISPNMISLLVGWDGLGLVSYCLVIYYQSLSSYNSGMLTILMNRVGDVFILMIIVWMINYSNWSFMNYMFFYKTDILYLYIGLMTFLGAITKSAQIPFSAWLPAAMAAPTPVSSLVHSSTLVTAGVYLMIRFNELLINSFVYKILLLCSVITMFLSGMVANYEYDLKKIIAYSTLSQLGLMLSILALGEMLMCYFHLLTHAMFKALLFMCAGFIIHKMKNFQDIRYMGNLIKFMPMIGICFMCSNLALSGYPFLSGFYSKDLILDSIMMMEINLLIWILFFVSTGFTVSYSLRVLYYSIFTLSFKIVLLNMNDQDYIMVKSMLILMNMSIMGGCMLSWLIFKKMTFIYLPLYLKLMTLFIIFIGLIIGIFYLKIFNTYMNNMMMYFLSYFNYSLWFMSILSGMLMNNQALKIGYYLGNNMNYGWSEYLFNKYMYYSLNNMFFYLNKNYFMFFKFFMFIIIFWIFYLFMSF